MSELQFDNQRNLRFGIAVVVLGFLGFIVWATVAQISSASVAVGKVIAESNVKTIEHYEGGIVERLFVREGDRVSAGDVLVELARDQAAAKLHQLEAREMSDSIRLQRLKAEQLNADELVFNGGALRKARADDQFAQQLTQQKILFEQRRESLKTRISIYDQQRHQLKLKVAGLEREKVQAAKGLGIVEEQQKMFVSLVEKGSLPKIQLMELDRKESELRGALHKLDSQIAVTREQFLEVELKAENERKSNESEINAQIEDLQESLAETREALIAAGDVLERVRVVSPVDGVVVSVHENTVGGVVGSGDPLVDVIPQADVLIVEALASAQDIDVLRHGQSAKVRLTAYNFRELSPLNAKLSYISADIIEDEKRELSGYRIKLTLDVAEIPEFVEVYPGMAAEVMVLTGSRSLLRYLLDPLFEVFYRSLRES